MRNRKKQRELRRAGVRREEQLGPWNGGHYIDPTPREAVKNIIKERKIQK